MSLFSFLLIIAGLGFVRIAIRGTKPSSTVLWGTDSASKLMKTGERISWSILGVGLILLGAFQLFSRHSS
jgi:hypothetical protein